MATLHSSMNLYNLVETYLRKAAKETKPLTVNQLFMIPDIFRVAYDKQQVNAVVNAFRKRECLLEFEVGKHGRQTTKSYAWKDDTPTPQMIHRLYKKKGRVHKPEPFVNQPQQAEQTFYRSIGPEHVLNKPTETGRHSSAEPQQSNVPKPAELSMFAAAFTAIGYKIKAEIVNGKRRFTIEEE